VKKRSRPAATRAAKSFRARAAEAALAALPLATLFAIGPAHAQTASYQNEVTAGVTYEGGRTNEPLVVVNGSPIGGFVFRGDEIERALAFSGTHLFRPAADDGTTPLALLAFVARVSSLRLDASLAARSDDSTGTSAGQQVSITSSLTGDRSTRAAGLSGEWFFSRATSARAGLSGTWQRETDATRQLESPSGRGDLATLATRISSGRATLGIARRFGSGEAASGSSALLRGLEAEVALDGAYGWRTFTRHDDILFSEGGFRTIAYDLPSSTRALALSARALGLGRRLLVEAKGAYSSAHGALTQDERTKIDRSTATQRSLSGSATYYATRCVGLTAGATYQTETDTGGLVSEQRTQTIKTVSWLLGARVFVTPKASVSATFTRAEKTTLFPPQGVTFQRLEETTSRVELAGAIRF